MRSPLTGRMCLDTAGRHVLASGLHDRGGEIEVEVRGSTDAHPEAGRRWSQLSVSEDQLKRLMQV